MKTTRSTTMDYICEYMTLPATGIWAFSIAPVADSVMYNAFLSAPPYARLVVPRPAQDLIRNSGSPILL